ncbi:hypothetical protein ISN44_As13g006090 [Arabidopsis suecica]|uniref:Transmembrane protein n=1 Tax=Arabidopsis suecica TaxID=45249 RepID=A0A8T1XZZ7_ARASU|nr:hypothetical protein ISN44_As13g006090 [Arabidopsis suecica]
MEKKNVFVLFLILLLVFSSLLFERVDGRALRLKPFRDINGHDQSSATMKVKKNSTSKRPLVKSFAYRLASGPSRRGRGH